MLEDPVDRDDDLPPFFCPKRKKSKRQTMVNKTLHKTKDWTRTQLKMGFNSNFPVSYPLMPPVVHCEWATRTPLKRGWTHMLQEG